MEIFHTAAMTITINDLLLKIHFPIFYSSYIYLVDRILCKHQVCRAVAQSIIVELSTNKDVEPPEMRHRPNV